MFLLAWLRWLFSSVAEWFRRYWVGSVADDACVDRGIWVGGTPDCEPVIAVPVGVRAVLDLRLLPPQWRRASLRALCWMPIADGDWLNIDWLEAATKTIAAWRSAGWEVLVHCSCGVSRSVTVIIAYEMKKNRWTVAQALAEVRKNRPLAAPHPHFLIALREYERWLGR